MPDPLLQALGVAEIFGAVCLVVPDRLGAGPRLTSLAAAGLTMIGMGAAAVTVLAEGMAEAAFPAVVALLAALVAVGRSPRRGRA